MRRAGSKLQAIHTNRRNPYAVQSALRRSLLVWCSTAQHGIALSAAWQWLRQFRAIWFCWLLSWHNWPSLKIPLKLLNKILKYIYYEYVANPGGLYKVARHLKRLAEHRLGNGIQPRSNQPQHFGPFLSQLRDRVLPAKHWIFPTISILDSRAKTSKKPLPMLPLPGINIIIQKTGISQTRFMSMSHLSPCSSTFIPGKTSEPLQKRTASRESGWIMSDIFWLICCFFMFLQGLWRVLGGPEPGLSKSKGDAFSPGKAESEGPWSINIHVAICSPYSHLDTSCTWRWDHVGKKQDTNGHNRLRAKPIWTCERSTWIHFLCRHWRFSLSWTFGTEHHRAFQTYQFHYTMFAQKNGHSHLQESHWGIYSLCHFQAYLKETSRGTHSVWQAIMQLNSMQQPPGAPNITPLHWLVCSPI